MVQFSRNNGPTGYLITYKIGRSQKLKVVLVQQKKNNKDPTSCCRDKGGLNLGISPKEWALHFTVTEYSCKDETSVDIFLLTQRMWPRWGLGVSAVAVDWGSISRCHLENKMEEHVFL